MDQLSPEQRHQREILTGITLPFGGVLLLMALLIGVAVAVLNPIQFSILADLLAILFILVPYVILCLIPTLLLMAGALGLWAVQGRIARPIRHGRRKLVATMARGSGYIGQAGKPVIALQGRLAYWEHLLSHRRAQPAPEEETKP